MSEPDEMDKPLTKREFRAEFQAGIAELATKRELHAGIADLVTKRELQTAINGAVTDLKSDMHANFVTNKTFAEFQAMFAKVFETLLARIDAVESRLFRELVAQISGITKEHYDDLGKHDNKYKDLPDRVTKLEAAVFSPPPAKRQRRR